MNPSQRLARRFVASYFSVGDLILYGKYKNKKGRILEFGHDPKGNPTILIEPIPKGRKQNKLMGLFKIWKAPIDKQAMTLAEVRNLKGELLTEMGLKQAAVADRDDAFYEVWADRLAKEAEGLDLKDAEDRATFRGNVLNAVQNLKADGLKDLAEKMGGPVTSSRDSLVKTIANAYIAGKRLKTAKSDQIPRHAMNQTVLVARVVNAWHRYARENINVGETFEKDNLRIHRYRDHFRITDTTNAGKRGKRVKTMALSLKKWTSSEELYSWLNNIGGLLAELGSYQEVVRLMKDVSVDYPGEIDMSESEERGVDVTPAGFVELKIRGDHVYVEVGYKDFTVKNLDDQANEPTCIPAIKGGIKAIPVFYRWVRDNQSKINNMKYLDVLNAMKDLDVPYHDYCAMD